jgi:hypothetical protein
MWEIRRGTTEQRFMRVEISRASFVVTDLPAEAQNAIRSRGATAVDSYLHHEKPPSAYSCRPTAFDQSRHHRTESH